MHLDRPIGVGDLVDVHASLVYTADSSLHVLVTICSYDPHRANSGQISQCPMVFVAVTENGDPLDVSPWIPVTMLELQRQRQARARVRMRYRIEDALAAQSSPTNDVVPQSISRVITVPVDIGPAVQGGRLLRWFDEAACACGTDWTEMDMVTSYLAGICVQGAVVTGDAVEVTARMIHTGPRSVHASVRITSSDPQGGPPRVVAHGVAVVVSIDEHSDARPVRRWRPDSAQDVRLDEHARHLIALRRFIEPFTTAAAEPADDITTL
jgi:4-hydroxybenzoyl-CoA thioesterase